MKLCRLGLLAMLLCAPLIGVASAPTSGVLSHRVLRAERALGAWLEAGTATSLGLPAPFQAAVRNLPEPGGAFAPGKEPSLNLMALTEDPAALIRAGYTVRTIAGEVVTLSAPLSRIQALAEVEGVRYVDVPLPVKPLLDVSSTPSHANFEAAHGSSQPPYPGVTGAGVVVGIIDSGIDFTHDDFKNADGTTRITKIWDQNDGVGPNPNGFGYGTEWTSAAIDAGTARQRDRDGHGTHVAGIAVGNGRATDMEANRYTYTGVAPEAEILAVNTTFLEDSILDAINWIHSNAAGKPVVVNMSLGGQFGGHDGGSFLDTGMAGLAGPGRILVAAAGNEGKADLHAETLLGPNGIEEVELSVGSYSAKSGSANDVVFIEGWYPSSGNLRATVITPTGVTVGPVTTSQQVSIGTADGQVDLAIAPGPDGTTRFVEIILWDQEVLTPPKSGTWKIRLENISGATNLEVDSWIPFSFLGAGAAVQWLNFIDDEEMIASPASSDSVIAVAAYVSKSNWPSGAGGTCRYSPEPDIGSIAPFSSDGPLRDGVLKPEISAPGMGIASARGADAAGGFIDACATTTDGVHVTSQGTSQATPHVTGAVALILQNNPNASYQDVVHRLVQTATHDAFTGPGYSTEFGNGKLEVNAAVNFVVPVRFLSLTASWEEGAARIRWELAETEPGAQFTVERGVVKTGPFAAVSEALAGGSSFVWDDPNPEGAEPWYRVRSRTRDGGIELFGPVRLDPLAGPVRLWQNAPNPFSSRTVIAFELDRATEARLDIIDVTGRRVTTLVSGMVEPGGREIEWNGTDGKGRPAAAGIYFYRLTTSESVHTRRLVLSR